MSTAEISRRTSPSLLSIFFLLSLTFFRRDQKRDKDNDRDVSGDKSRQDQDMSRDRERNRDADSFAGRNK